jgi:hypothetical protein
VVSGAGTEEGFVMAMTRQRYVELVRNFELKLTEEEMQEGWHFCCDWDGMLIQKGRADGEECTCELPTGTSNS